MMIQRYIKPLLLLAGSFILLQGCGNGSGAAVQSNPVTQQSTVSNYSGPAPETADVQAFKREVWDNLVSDNRCGECHNPSQTPRFVRSDDINLAYEAALTVVDLNDPGQSIMVAKVAGGHNCWESNANVCADNINRWITNWAGNSGGGPAKTVQLLDPPLQDPGDSRNFPSDPALFATTVWPLLTDYCSGCHTDAAATPQSPYFASSDVYIAYDAAQSKIDLEIPENSRFVVRLGKEFHNCWGPTPDEVDCESSASIMQQAVTDLIDGISPTQVDPDLITSKALGLPDGIISSAGGRHETNAIALYEFKTGSGNVAYDTSGVEPLLNLTLSDDYNWVGGWGIQFIDGKAQGSTTASAKIRNLIQATNEYSIEAWVVPANVTQDGPARIVSYSGGPMNRNFMLGQTLYSYDTFNRNTETDQNGEPQLSTSDVDEDLQASLQHVVVTYDPIDGRRIFVNGTFTDDEDTVVGGLLNDWDDTYALAIASEVDNNNRWAGTMRLLAIHNRVLTDEQILQNFEVGVGEKYFLLFNVSEHIGIDQAYVVFEVSQFDNYGYLFNEPFFTLLDATATPGSIPMEGIRIGLNGRELAVGQAFKTLNVNINDADYQAEGRQWLSALGTVIALEKGPALDQFFLTFERLGDATNVVVEAAPIAPPPPADAVNPVPSIGIRNFAEINATMASMTGVPTSHTGVMNTYNLVKQAMPVQPLLGGFISSQQMGVTQLAIQYCSAIVDDPVLRGTMFPDFDFNAPIGTAFNDTAPVISPLINRMVGSGLATQPDIAGLTTEVDNLINRLVNCGANCSPDRTERVVKAACASVLGSAAMLVQ